MKSFVYLIFPYYVYIFIDSWESSFIERLTTFMMTIRQKTIEEVIASLQEITTNLQRSSENHAANLQTLTTNFNTMNVNIQKIYRNHLWNKLTKSTLYQSIPPVKLRS